MHLIPSGATSLLRRHLESGPSDRQTAGAATRHAGNRHRAGDLTARPAWLPGGHPFPREQGRRQPGAGSGHHVRLSRTNHTGNRTGLQSSEPLWDGEAPEDAPTCQAAATRLGAAGAWDLGGCRPAERFRKRRRVLGVPGQSAMGPQRSPTTGHGPVTGHRLGALPCWGRSAPGWAWGRASALRRRPLLAGYTQPRLVWSSSSAASWLWSSWGCSPPSPAPRASLRTYCCAYCSSRAAGRWGQEGTGSALGHQGQTELSVPLCQGQPSVQPRAPATCLSQCLSVLI